MLLLSPAIQKRDGPVVVSRWRWNLLLTDSLARVSYFRLVSFCCLAVILFQPVTQRRCGEVKGVYKSCGIPSRGSSESLLCPGPGEPERAALGKSIILPDSSSYSSIRDLECRWQIPCALHPHQI